MKNIETERLYLTRAKLKDSNFIFELLNSTSWLKYIGDKNITTKNLEHADLGFALLPIYEGFGYAFEATYAIMEFGESELDFKKVMAICMETNQRSLQLLSKLGFKKIDTITPSEASEELLLLST